MKKLVIIATILLLNFTGSSQPKPEVKTQKKVIIVTVVDDHRKVIILD